MELCMLTRAMGQGFNTHASDAHGWWLRGSVATDDQNTNFRVVEDLTPETIGAVAQVNVVEGAEGFVLRGLTQKLNKMRKEMESRL